jgi:hypothetical protein
VIADRIVRTDLLASDRVPVEKYACVLATILVTALCQVVEPSRRGQQRELQTEWKTERKRRETHEKKTNFMINVTTACAMMTTMMSVLGSLASEI